MAWTTPRLWTTGELVTASMMNTHVRDNLAYLKGSAGTVAFDSGITVPAITTVDWFRITGSSFGIYNQTHNQGVGINASGPYNYINGQPLVDLTLTQSLANKTLNDPKWTGVSGFYTNSNDLTNYMFYWTTGTATLPAASGRAGQVRFIKAWGGNVTVNSGSTNLMAPGSSGSIVSSFTLTSGDSLTLVCDGTYWWVV